MGVDSLIQAIDDMIIADESLSDISIFMENPDYYLDMTKKKNVLDENNSYASALDIDGELYLSIEKACNELVKVNAYQEAISIYEEMIKICKELKDHVTKNSDKTILNTTIDEFKTSIMQVMKQRTQYTSRRKSILGKYSDIIKRLK